MPDQEFERLVAEQLANETGPPPAPPPAADPSWNPLAALLRQLTGKPEWATEPTPEQVEARRERDKRIEWTQEAEHATAPPLQRLLQNIGNAGMGFAEGTLGASDELYSGQGPVGANELGRLIGEIGIPTAAMAAAPGDIAKVLKGIAPRATKGGLYSRVEDVARQIPPKGINPQRLASQLKSGASSEEMAVRQVPEFLARHGNTPVTPEAVEAHLAANPAPFPQVVTKGNTTTSDAEPMMRFMRQTNEAVPQTPQEWTALSDRFTGIAQQWQRNGDRAQANRFFEFSEQATQVAEGLDLGRGGPVGMPKFAKYQLPGGENYQERLLTLPGRPASPELLAREAEASRLQREAMEYLDSVRDQPGEGLARRRLSIANEYYRQANQAATAASKGQNFQGGHWDEPNVLVHVRHNDRTLPTGERGRFLEEVQSDWHQKGKEQGYKGVVEPVDTSRWTTEPTEHGWKVKDADGELMGRVFRGDPAGGAAETPEDAIDYVVQNIQRSRDNSGRVPDAPFKENWPDLALKQQLIEVADDPNISWLGFTDGKTQADRYDLSKQVKRVYYVPETQQLVAYDHDRNMVMQETVAPEKVKNHIGKEAASKLFDKPMTEVWRDSLGTRMGHDLSGLDLQVGGEGMKKFYDELLPKRMEKLVKPFGGTVERLPLGSRSTEMIDAEMDALHAADLTDEQLRQGLNRLQHERNGAVAAPAWVVRLTPEMKAKIKAAGLPLMAAPLAVAASGEQEPQQ